jgi:hypothetical protein
MMHINTVASPPTGPEGGSIETIDRAERDNGTRDAGSILSAKGCFRG